jgi:hypothetical protein
VAGLRGPARGGSVCEEAITALDRSVRDLAPP